MFLTTIALQKHIEKNLVPSEAGAGNRSNHRA